MTDLISPFFCCGADVNANAPNNIPADYRSDSTQLFKAIETQNWDLAIGLLKQRPDEAKLWVTAQGMGGIGPSWRRLPIHEACIHRPTEAIITALIQANPMGVREKDSDGQLPLHHAVENGASLGVVQELILSCPDALDVKNRWGNYPEDIANSTASKEVRDALKKRPSVYAVQAYKKTRTKEEEKMKKEFIKQVAEEKLRSMNSVKEARAEEAKKAQAKIEDLSQALTRVTAERDAANEKISSTEGTMKKLKYANAEIYAEKKSADDKVAELNGIVTSQEMEIEKLKQENAKINSNVASIERQIDVFKRVNERLMIENTEYKGKVDRMLEMFSPDKGEK